MQTKVSSKPNENCLRQSGNYHEKAMYMIKKVNLKVMLEKKYASLLTKVPYAK